MKLFAYFTVAVALGYAVEWVPRYVAFISGNNLSVVGSIAKYRESCTKPENKLTRCSDRYRIPLAEIKNTFPEFRGIGLGILIAGTEIYCSSDSDRTSRYGDIKTGSRAYELLKIYQTADLDFLDCRNEIVVDAWSPKLHRRSGYIGGPLLAGDIHHIEIAKGAVEFFTKEIYFFLAIGLVVCFLITSILIRPLVRLDETTTSFDAYSKFWVAFALMKSGLIEIALPMVSSTLVYVRMANFFSLIAHIGPLLHAIASGNSRHSRLKTFAHFLGRTLEKRSGITPFHILSIALVASPYFAKALGACAAILIPAYFFIGLRRQDKNLIVFSAIMAFEAWKYFDSAYAPYGLVALPFVSCLIFDQFIKRVQYGARIVGLLLWSKRNSIERNYEATQQAVRELSEMFGISQVSVLEPIRDGNCRITIQRQIERVWQTDWFYRETIPPVFSHVLTTREPLLNLHEDSDLSMHVRGLITRRWSYGGKYFTVIPVLKDDRVLAAVAFSSYDPALFFDSTRRLELEFGIELLSSILANSIWAANTALSDDWYRRCVRANEKMLASDVGAIGEEALETALIRALEILASDFDCRGIIARLNPLTRELDQKIIFGYDPKLVSLYQATRFFALTENAQGLMPLAINRRRVITAPDLSWILSSLHHKSQELLRLSEAKSAVAVPIMLPKTDEKCERDTWGVLWLESKQAGYFSARSEEGLKVVSSAIEAIVARQDMRKKAQTALEGLVRPDIADRLLRDLPVREEERGYLLVADIRGSSSIANQLGADTWNRFVSQLREPLAKLSGHYGLSLQLTIWDAFYFTKEQHLITASEPSDIIQFCAEMNALLCAAFTNEFGDSPLPEDGSRARFCLEYGDITRDIHNGTWTITGNAMAAVSKLEAACKALPGWFFLSEAILPENTDPYQILPEVNPATNRKIVRLKSNVDSVMLSDRAINQLKILPNRTKKAA